MHPFGFDLATVGVFVPLSFHSVAITMCWTALSEEPYLEAMNKSS